MSDANTKEVKVETVMVKAMCPHSFECDGEMRPGGTVLTSNPIQFPHECNVCGAKETYDRSYPYITYKEI